MKRLLALLLLLAACAAPEAPPPPPASLRLAADKGPVRMRVELSPEKARLSDRIELRLTVEAKDGVEVGSPVLEFETFQVLDRREEPVSFDGKGRRVFTTVATLEPKRSGELSIGPFVVEFTREDKSHQIEIEPATLVVTSAVRAPWRSRTALVATVEP